MATKNFKRWETEEIMEWLWNYETVPSLQTPYNYYTYILAIQEIKDRKIPRKTVEGIIECLGEFNDF